SQDDEGLVYAILRPLYAPDRSISGLLFLCDELADGALSDTLARAPLDDDQEQDRIELARQFAVTLNHEINNPLFVVSATLEDIRIRVQQQPNPPVRKHVRPRDSSTRSRADEHHVFGRRGSRYQISGFPR